MNNFPTVDIIFPVRDRAKYLPTFLENISKLDYPKDKITFRVCVNDSSDDSYQILSRFFAQFNYNFHLKKISLNTPEYNENNRGNLVTVKKKNKIEVKNTAHEVYRNLAKIRNGLIHNSTADYIFSVDTDIMVKPNTLKTLITNTIYNRYDFMSAFICNGHVYVVRNKDNLSLENQNPYLYTNAMKKDKDGIYRHIKGFDITGIVEVDLSGAVFVATKKLYSKARYGESKFGEDAIFCDTAQKLGFKLGCNTDHKLAHCMTSEFLQRYKEKTFEF